MTILEEVGINLRVTVEGLRKFNANEKPLKPDYCYALRYGYYVMFVRTDRANAVRLRLVYDNT